MAGQDLLHQRPHPELPRDGKRLLQQIPCTVKVARFAPLMQQFGVADAGAGVLGLEAASAAERQRVLKMLLGHVMIAHGPCQESEEAVGGDGYEDHGPAKQAGKLLLVEMVIAPGDEPDFGKLLDLHMLAVAPGGRERTEAEYRALLTSAGFDLRSVLPTGAGPSVIEAIPV